MLFVLGTGGLHRASSRTSQGRHWGIYHRAVKEVPGLLEAMRATITSLLDSDRYLDSDGRFPNSSWLGSEILGTWDRREEWDCFCGTGEASSTLFGQIMWTAVYDHDRSWCTTKTSSSDCGKEERVYWLMEHDQTPSSAS